jgi:hypothetical protein
MEYFCKKCNKAVMPLPCGCCFDCSHGGALDDDKFIEVRLSLWDLYHLMKLTLSQEEFDLGFSFDALYFKVNEMKKGELNESIT